MIPSVDTYVYTQLESKLKAILRHPKILQEALSGIDKKARDNFINTYSGDKPIREIQVSYHFPGMKENFDARYVVQMGTGHETNRSIGSVESTFTFREGEEKLDYTVIMDGGEYLYFDVTSPVGQFHSTNIISFAETDNLKVEDNRFTFRKWGNEQLVGSDIGVRYLSKIDPAEEEDPIGLKKGYSSNEEVEVTPLSNNMDTARCLDALLKVIMIIMLDNDEEKTGFLLQKTTFNAMQNIISDADRLVFGRPLTLEYVVTYTVDYDLTRKISEVVLRGFDGLE